MTAVAIRPLLAWAAAAALVLSACGTPPATSPTAIAAGPNRAAIISEIIGDVKARRSAAESFVQAILGLVLNVGGQVRTGDQARARIDFSEGNVVRLAENTSLTVEALRVDDVAPNLRFQFDGGKVWISLFGGTIELDTPVGVAAVRGSFAVVEYVPGDPADPDDDVLILDCLEGSCGARNNIVDERLGNLERVVLMRAGPPQRGSLTTDDILRFIQSNPETGSVLAATLAAVPTSTPTLTPTSLAPMPTTAPSIAPTASPSAAPTPSPTPAASAAIVGRHTVRGGETLYCIGRAYGVLPEAIAQVNGLAAPYRLVVGQPLNVPAVRWINIAPGPVCAAQFYSPYAPPILVPTIVPPSATFTSTPTGTLADTVTPSPTPSVSPTIAPDTSGPLIHSSSANPDKVSYPYCTVTFVADISDLSGVAAANVLWLSSASTSGSQPMAFQNNAWQVTFIPHVPYAGTTTWFIIAVDHLGNASSGGGGTLVYGSALGRSGGVLAAFALAPGLTLQRLPDCGGSGVTPTP